MSIPVVVLGGDELLIRRIEGHRGELVVTRVCEEMSEAVALCAAGGASVLLVAQTSLMPSPEQIDLVVAQRVILAVLVEDDDERALSEDIVRFSPDAAAEVLEAGITDALEKLDFPDVPDVGAGQTGENGRVVCFWGATGAPGRSTVSLNYAAEAANAGESVVLIDADTYAASIASLLGLMEESAAVVQLCRAVDGVGADALRMEAQCLNVRVGDANMSVATGIPRASRWPEVRPSALRKAVSLLRQRFDRVVVDLSSCIETDEQLSFDTHAPQRNGVPLELMRIADEVVMVVAADSIGVPRAIRALDELDEQVPGAPVKILFNKVSAAGVGASPQRRLAEAWQRFGPMHPVIGYLPNDATVCDAAVLAGSPLLEISPRCSLRREIRAILGHSGGKSRHGRGRLLLGARK
ncbi:P-loop NTPase [Glutamicibacter endophyticus]